MSSQGSQHQIEDLLAELGRVLGFRFSPEAQTRLIHEPLADAEVFTDAVFREQGLDPASDIPSLRRVARRMVAHDILKREFDAEEGSFLIQARVRLEWDWDAFRRLTSAMYDVADEAKGQPSVETWIAQGFWYCDTFIRDWTSHPNFPRPPEEAYQDALELLRSLASFLFTGLNPYNDDTLRKKAKG